MKYEPNRLSPFFIIIWIFAILLMKTNVGASAALSAPLCDAKAAAQVMGAAFSWDGDCRDGLPEGRGAATFPDGRLFFGDMAAGLFQGTGTLTLPGGERYTGEFAAGRFHGQGVYTFSNGDRYVGEFREGVFHGSGVFRKPGDEERYLVEYENGEQTKFEVDAGASALVNEPALVGVRSEVLRRVAKVQAYTQRTLGLMPIYTSGYRNAAKNAAVGGVLDSLHMQGKAVDLVVDGIVAEQEERIAAFARQQGLWALWHGVGDNHHLHLQWDEE
ncbi:MAG: putative protein in bacteria [Firmicutes bacterium]|nr:putative protein in bacteria [Bacillota bacterium]